MLQGTHYEVEGGKRQALTSLQTGQKKHPLCLQPSFHQSMDAHTFIVS